MYMLQKLVKELIGLAQPLTSWCAATTRFTRFTRRLGTKNLSWDKLNNVEELSRSTTSVKEAAKGTGKKLGVAVSAHVSCKA